MTSKIKTFFLKLDKIYTICLFLLIFQAKVSANSLKVSPVNTYVTVGGGESTTLDYQLTNNSQQDIVVSLRSLSFKPDSQYGQPQLLPTSNFPYLTLLENDQPTETITIPAGATNEITLQVNPPVGIEVKEFPLTLLFAAHAIDQPDDASSISFEVGSNLIVRTDTSGQDLSLLSAKLSPLDFLVDTFTNPQVQVTIDNNGPFSTLIDGQLTLKRDNGDLVVTWPFHQDLVLGESSRLARASTGTDALGREFLATNFSLGRFLLGHYVLEVDLHSAHPQAGDHHYYATTSFWALPYWIILAVLVLAGLIWLYRRVMDKKRPTNQLRAKQAKLQKQRQYFDQP